MGSTHWARHIIIDNYGPKRIFESEIKILTRAIEGNSLNQNEKRFKEISKYIN